MSCLGVHFALSASEVIKLRAAPSDSTCREVLQEIEADYFDHKPLLMAESNKAWDAMHRLLSDGELSFTSGPEPRRWVVLGGESLYRSDDYIMSLKALDQVQAVAREVSSLDQAGFYALYEAMDPEQYGYPKSDEDCGCTWEYFRDVIQLFQTAAAENRYVLFTADQ